MKYPAAAFLFAALAAAPALAADGPRIPGPRVPDAVAGTCESAIAGAASRHGVPPTLLASVGLLESGNHPFALNIDGKASYPQTYRLAEQEALSAIRGGRQVDIGCMQINVSRHHKKAFPTLLHALHPEWNADYGARYMRELFDRYGDWTLAAANYHSARRSAQIRYVAELGRRMSAMAAQPPAVGARHPGTSATPSADPRRERAERAARIPAVQQASR